MMTPATKAELNKQINNDTSDESRADCGCWASCSGGRVPCLAPRPWPACWRARWCPACRLPSPPPTPAAPGTHPSTPLLTFAHFSRGGGSFGGSSSGGRQLVLDTDAVELTVRPYYAILSLENSILPPINYGRHMSASSPSGNAANARLLQVMRLWGMKNKFVRVATREGEQKAGSGVLN
eukprot:579670-Prorocentrum_minimum.AAC.2